MRSIAERLAEPFDPADVKFKPAMVKGNRALAMGYVDARLVQDRLDEVVGVEGWSDRYAVLPGDSVKCELTVNMAPDPAATPNRVTKEDVGSPSEQPDAGDRMKAAFSDALKRAAVKFGIGRYLYRLSSQWVDYDPQKKQLLALPQLPAWAIPEGCKPCGTTVANQLYGFIRQVGTLYNRNPDKVTSDILLKYHYKPDASLAAVEKRHASAMLQDLHKVIRDAAADQPPPVAKA